MFYTLPHVAVLFLSGEMSLTKKKMFDGKKEIVSACTFVSDEVSETFVLKLL